MSNNSKADFQHFITKYSKVLILLFFVIIISIPILELAYLFGIKGIFNYFSERIIDTTGVNQYLAKAIILLFTIPLIWSFKWTFSLFPSKRKAGYAIISGYIVMFYFSMFFFTRNQMFDHKTGQAIKYCAQSPEGLFCSGTDGYDPKYGIKLIPMDPNIARSFALQKNPPQRLEYPSKFFDFATSQPLVWYYQYPDGKLEFFDQPGYHPKYAEELKPITADIVKGYEKEQAAEEEAKEMNSVIEKERNKSAVVSIKLREVYDIKGNTATTNEEFLFSLPVKEPPWPQTIPGDLPAGNYRIEFKPTQAGDKAWLVIERYNGTFYHEEIKNGFVAVNKGERATGIKTIIPSKVLIYKR